MSDLISRQDAIAYFFRPYSNEELYSNTDIEKALNALPSADAVEVVRCKDCKHWHREIRNGIEYFNFSSCDLNHYGDGHNFYCADAERR